MASKRLAENLKNHIDEINNIQIHAEYCQMVFRLARWRCGWEFFVESLVKKSDANVEDSDCTVRMLLFISMGQFCLYDRSKNNFDFGEQFLLELTKLLGRCV